MGVVILGLGFLTVERVFGDGGTAGKGGSREILATNSTYPSLILPASPELEVSERIGEDFVQYDLKKADAGKGSPEAQEGKLSTKMSVYVGNSPPKLSDLTNKENFSQEPAIFERERASWFTWFDLEKEPTGWWSVAYLYNTLHQGKHSYIVAITISGGDAETMNEFKKVAMQLRFYYATPQQYAEATAQRTSAAWPYRPYAEVRAYYFEQAEAQEYDPIVRDGKLSPDLLNTKEAVVPPAKVKELLGILHTKRYSAPLPGCYRPHHAMVFYDKDKKVVGYYEVCFSCLLQSCDPQGLPPLTDMAAVAQIFADVGLPFWHGGTAEEVKEKWERACKIVAPTSIP